MSTTASTSTYNPYTGQATFTSTSSGPGLVGGTLTTAYLYLLIGLGIIPTVVLVVLLLRTHFLRRRIRRSLEESLRTGGPLPFETAFTLGWAVPDWKKPVPIGRTPELWEVDQKHELGLGERGWDGITPVSVICTAEPRYTFTLPATQSRSFFSRLMRPFQVNNLPPEILQQAMALHQFHTGTMELAPRERFLPAESGEEVTVGVLIAMPQVEEERNREDGEERVKEVYLGVLDCKVVKG